jgi:hypothetical protein
MLTRIIIAVVLGFVFYLAMLYLSAILTPIEQKWIFLVGGVIIGFIVGRTK